MTHLKAFIKVPLVLGENFFFLLFPFLRPLVEKYLYNPLDFKNNHLEYSQRKFKEFSELTNTSLQDKTLLELGPGGSLGFGLLALEKGLAQYFAIDDGLHTFISSRQITSYKNLLKNNSDAFAQYFQKTPSGWRYQPKKIRSLTIDQTSKYPLADESVDIIYSCAVLEHVHALDLCFSEMTRVLRPGGIMYHEVDLRDHIFSQKSLWFLTISDFWFHILFSRTGAYVNRKRFSFYKKLFDKNNLKVVNFHRNIEFEASLKKNTFREFSSEDLQIATFTVVLRKKE